MIPDKIKFYILHSLEGTPFVMRSLLGRFAGSDSIWDMRPHADRFTLREVLAHLADWDEIFLDRIRQTVNDDNPTLPNFDQDQIAIDRAYARQDASRNMERFTKNRIALISYVQSLPEQAFDRSALRPEIGPMTVAMQLTLILAHDGYHLRQAAEYVETSAAS